MQFRYPGDALQDSPSLSHLVQQCYGNLEMDSSQTSQSTETGETNSSQQTDSAIPTSSTIWQEATVCGWSDQKNDCFFQ